MKCLKRSILFLLSLLIFIISFQVSALAVASPIVDNAGLLSDLEKEELVSSINEFKEDYKIDLAIVTSDGLGGKDAQSFADDFYEENNYGIGKEYSGVLLLIDMQERDICISTEGQALNYFDDNRLDSIIEDVSKYLSNEQYLDGFKIFITDIKYYMDLGTVENQQLYSENTNVIKVLIIALIVGIIAATIACLIVVFSYKSPKATSSINYVDRDSIKFNKKKDIFINTYTTRSKIEKNNDNGGKTTVHKSSSGRTHGGRTGKF